MTKPLNSLLNMLLQRNPDLRCKSWTEVKQHEFFKVMACMCLFSGPCHFS